MSDSDEIQTTPYVPSPPVRRYRRQAQPSSAELMRRYRITWGKVNGKRVLYVPSSAPEGAAKEVCDAIARERKG